MKVKDLSIRVVLLPSMLRDEDIAGRSVVVFDVLRATTTIATALGAGVKEIRVFGSLDDARSAANGFAGARLLAGEENCLPPAGFDLGNSPGDYTPERCADRTMFLSTTNGTRALVASKKAERLFAGALVNARATARALIDAKLPVTLLCAGTAGQVAMEDLLGCGAVLCEIEHSSYENDEAKIAHFLWKSLYSGLNVYLRVSQGGQNIVRSGLEQDIDFAAQLNRLDLSVNVEDRRGMLVALPGTRYA